MDSPPPAAPAAIYHEKQKRLFCALHALNNLFQQVDTFTKQQFDQICEELTPGKWCNPHRNSIGLGNYDINVIMRALQQRNYEVIWFDKRRDPSTLKMNQIFGFVLNRPDVYWKEKLGWLLPIEFRHWLGIRKFENNLYINLDSKLNAPQEIGAEAEFITFLREQLQLVDLQLFLIVTRDVETAGTWRLPSEDQS